jgi:hypothetical protein
MVIPRNPDSKPFSVDEFMAIHGDSCEHLVDIGLAKHI